MNAAIPVVKVLRTVFAVLTIAVVGIISARAADSGSRLRNFSARGVAGVGGDALFAGYIVSGGSSQSLLVRGVGPTLSDFGVTGVLADPMLASYAGATLIGSNDDWPVGNDLAKLTAATSSMGAFALRSGSLDAAMLLNPVAGLNSSVVSAKAGSSGVALIEVYAGTGADAPRLTNLSARGRVGTGAGVLVAGFAIDGAAKTVLIRGIGPSLGAFGVSDVLSDPQIAVYRAGATTAFLRNDNWGGAVPAKAAFVGAGAFALEPTSKDAALVTTLDPGVYTVQLQGVSGATGIGLLEIYDLEGTSGAPTIAWAPSSLNVNRGATASLTVIPAGVAPFTFQWQKDGAVIPGATSDTLMFSPVTTDQAGKYTVTVSNAAGSVTSAPATVTVAAPLAALPPAATFDLVGFASLGAGATGGGALSPGDANYKVLDASVTNPAQQLKTWLESSTALVIDVQVDVDLGTLNNVGNRPRTNPELMASGLGTINVRSNKTLVSSTGATLRHGTLNISGQNNIIVRNLRFRGLWEFDEGSQDAPNNAPWGYKIQDWDYIDIQNGAKNVWIDHCDFEKSYDGIADTKGGADLVTFSWCRLGGDTEGAVARQIGYLEKLYQGQIVDSRIPATFYSGLRNGVYASQGIPTQSVADIVSHELPHDKCNLVGAGDTATGDIGYLNMTFHHIYYHGCRQRLPRMRFGNAHVFNLCVDNSVIRDGTNMATATTCDAAVFAENNEYIEVMDPFPAQSGTSPAGRITQLGCRWVYQGAEQSLAANTFLKDPTTWTWNTATKNFTWTTAPAPNRVSVPYSYRADAADYTRTNLAWVGVIVPGTKSDQTTLAGYLVRTTH